MVEEKGPKKEETVIKKMNPKILYTALIALVVAVAVLTFFLIRGRKAGPELSPQMKQMQETVQKIQSLETDIQEKQDEIFSTMAEYKEKTGQPLAEINLMNLSDEQKQILEDKIKKEQNVSIKSMLQEIVDKNKEISEMKGKVQELEVLLPKPHLVEQGENHYQIAMAFLINDKGVEKAQAMKLIEKSALFEPLIPGFKVWHFFANNEYGTFVTQGSAPISPNQVQRKVKKELVDAKDQAIAQRDKLQSDISELDKRREELISQLDLLNQEKVGLLAKTEELSKDMEEILNSLFYILNSKSRLKTEGILKGGFLRSTKLQQVPAEQFKLSIDLRKETSIQISARDLEMRKIKDATIYPKYFKEGIDYNFVIEAGRQNATLTILEPAKFKNERVVISLD